MIGAANAAWCPMSFRGDATYSYTRIISGRVSNAGASDYFGYAVSINGDNIIVSATKEDTTVTDAGSAYIFIKDDNQVE